MTEYNRVMNALRKWRESAGLSIHEVAKMTGIHPSQLSRYEHGHAGVSVDTALLLEKVSKGAVPVEAWSKDEAVRRRASR